MNITKYIEKVLYSMDNFLDEVYPQEEVDSLQKVQELIQKDYPSLWVQDLSSYQLANEKGWKESNFEFWNIEKPSQLSYKDIDNTYHVFLYINGLFYDIESPNGVSHWVELPFYKRLIEAKMIELAQRFVKLEYILSRKKKPSYHDYKGNLAHERFALDFKMFTERVDENIARREQGEKLYGEAFVKQVDIERLKVGKQLGINT